jgi:hypothetical protein
MRVTLLPFILLASSCAAYAVESTCPKHMPKQVEARLLPVLKALDHAVKTNNIWDKSYEREFNKLLSSKDRPSIEARVALMDYYTGESFGEALVCSVAKNGKKSITFLEQYGACDISPTQDRMPRHHDSPLRGYALKIILENTAQASCTYE